jgi:hypothetical protein
VKNRALRFSSPFLTGVLFCADSLGFSCSLEVRANINFSYISDKMQISMDLILNSTLKEIFLH